MRLTISKKLGFSFSIMLMTFFIASVFNYSMVENTILIQQRITDTRLKTVMLGENIETGIQASLAGLRGYMILASDAEKSVKMKNVRRDAWRKIDHSLQQFELISHEWTSEGNVNLLNQLILTLGEFRKAQLDVEAIVNTPDNIPSYKLLLVEAAPLAKIILVNLNDLIDKEDTLAASIERKKMLKLLADSRGSFAIGIANIRAYLLSGDESYKLMFEENWNINLQRYKDITKIKHLFTPSQLESWSAYSSLHQQFSSLPGEMFELRSSEQWNQANFLLASQAAPRAKKSLEILHQMRESQDKLLSIDIELLHEKNSFLKITLIVVSLLTILIGLVLATLLTRDILSRLIPIVKRAEDIANNDMTGEAIKEIGNDEITQLTHSINSMSSVLTELVDNTANSMIEVAAGAKDIQSANNAMSKEILKTHDQVNQIATAIEELSSSTKDIANNCTDASSCAVEASNLALQGGELAKNTVVKMEEIKETFSASASSITLLNERSQEIESIVNVIKGIADQTNLLALNAAIEAARAGEQGRGFAVVADEVRQLAQRTTEATTEVEHAIAAIHLETEIAVDMMTKGGEKVQQGFDVTHNTHQALTKIITMAQQVAHQIQTIAVTAEQQSVVTTNVARNSYTILESTKLLGIDSSNIIALVSTVNSEADKRSISLKSMITAA